MSERAALVKFGCLKHLQELQDAGLLYMNNLPYFWKIEDDELRGDPYDSIVALERGTKARIFLQDGRELPFRSTRWDIKIPPPEAENINVFCMYALRPSAGSFPVSERNFDFGDHALLIADPQQFIDRVAAQLRKERIDGGADLVQYVDDQYIGKVGPFRKLKRFAYQSEWRLVCYSGPGGPRTITLGSIRDISIIMPSKEINQRVAIDP